MPDVAPADWAATEHELGVQATLKAAHSALGPRPEGPPREKWISSAGVLAADTRREAFYEWALVKDLPIIWEAAGISHDLIAALATAIIIAAAC